MTGVIDPGSTGPSRAGEVLSPEAAGVDLLLADAVADAPAFGRIMEVAALPRSFDEALLGDLFAANAAADDDFQEALDWLVESPFVHERHDRSWALHDRVRGPLLQRWRETRPVELVELLAVLEQSYTRMFEQTCTAMASLAMTEDVVREANLERFFQITDVLEDQLIRTALETVHTAVRISFENGRMRLTSVNADLVQRGQFRSSEVLVRGWLASEQEVDEEHRVELRAWASYCLAEAMLASGRPDEALAALESVRDPQDVDLLFATWYYHQRASVLHRLNRFDEALAMLDLEIGIHDEHHVDDNNVSTPWIQKANIHALMRRTQLQTRAAEEAVERATALSSAAPQVYARVSLINARTAGGDQHQIAHELVQAFRTARLSLTDNPDRYLQNASKVLLRTAISTVGRRSPRLVAAWGGQLRQLSVGDGPHAEVDLVVEQANAVLDGGNTSAATALYASARQLVDERVPERRAELDAEEGGAAPLLGYPRRGAELNLGLLENETTDAWSWDRARWLSNAAWCLLDTGEYDRALELIPRAIEGWTRIGVAHALSLVYAIEGDLRRRSGDLDGADDALQRAHAILLDDVHCEPHAFLARLRADQADHVAAAVAATNAFAVAQRFESNTLIAQHGLLAVECLMRAARTEEASTHLEEVGRVLAEISEFRAWRPTEASELADLHAGRALRILVAGFGSITARSRSAIQHLEIATGADDAVGWYQVESGWAYTLLGQPKQARRAFGIAAEVMPTPALRDAVVAAGNEL